MSSWKAQLLKGTAHYAQSMDHHCSKSQSNLTGAVWGLGRCHPQIAAISNSQFYGGRLLDGCSAADRAPLVRGLPTLLCLDVRGSQDYASGSYSASNRAEASAIAQVQPDTALPTSPPPSPSLHSLLTCSKGVQECVRGSECMFKRVHS